MSAQTFTVADISSAISRQLTLPADHEGVRRFSGLLFKTVNERPEFQKGGLQGSGFTSLVLSNLPSELAELMDPAQRDKLLRQQQERANVTSAEGVALAIALGTREGLRFAAAQGNSSRFDDIETKGSSDWSSDKGQAQMRAFAIEKGVAWAAGRPDLLRLGPAALQVLAEVHLREESYRRLTTDAGFHAKDVVTLAEFAKKRGIDANDLSKTIADSAKALTGDDRQRQEELRKAVTGYMEKSNDQAAKDQLDKVLKQYENDPSKKEHVAKIREKLTAQRGKEQIASVAAAAEKDDLASLLAGATPLNDKLPKPDGPKTDGKPGDQQPSASRPGTPSPVAGKPQSPAPK
jgi:hypothetical protein